MAFKHFLTFRDINQDPSLNRFYLNLDSQQHVATQVQQLGPMRPSKVLTQLLLKRKIK